MYVYVSDCLYEWIEHLNFTNIRSWLNNTCVSTSMYPLGQNTLKTL